MYPSIRMASVAGMALGIAMLVQPVPAQKPSNPPSSGSSGGGVASRTGPGMPSSTPGPPSILTNTGIYLSGRVVMEDGTAPPEPATIERVCNASARAQAYTDEKGWFSFQVGRSATVVQDASEDDKLAPGLPTSPPGSTGGPLSMEQPAARDYRLDNCELRALLPGYRSDTISLAGRRVMDDPDLGTIVLHRLAKVEGTAVSVTTLEAPKDARKAYDKARAAQQRDDLAEAEKDLRKAVDIYPRYALAWYELGQLQEQNHDPVAARQSYHKALAADARFTRPYVRLAEMALQARNWQDLADTTRRLIELDPLDNEIAYFYNAIANLSLGRINQAEKSARAGVEQDAGHRYPKRVQLLAVILERKADYAGAAACLHQYLEWAPEAADAAQMKIRLARLEGLAGGSQEAQNQSAPR